MQLSWVIFLVVILLAGVNARPALKNPGAVNLSVANISVVPLIASKKEATPTRLLASQVAAIENDDESDDKTERVSTGAISLMTSRIRLSAENLENKLWLVRRMNPNDVFKSLRLGETGVKLDGNPAFLRWLKYVEMYNDKGYYRFSHNVLFDLLVKTKPEAELVPLFQSLRKMPGMQSFADELQRYMFLTTPSSHKLMRETWLKSLETPQDVFAVLRLQDASMDALQGHAVLLQWLRYTKMYRAKMGDTSFSDIQTFQLLFNSQTKSEEGWAVLFQTIIFQNPDLKKLAENMQTYLFQSVIKKKLTPEVARGHFGVPYEGFVVPRTNDPRFTALETYTLQFTKHYGDEAVMKEVKSLYADNNPAKAIAVASNLLKFSK